MNDTQKINAIKARLSGVWDDPDLMKIGPLGSEAYDIQRILDFKGEDKPAIPQDARQVCLYVEYPIIGRSTVELPEPYTWGDVEVHEVQYGELVLTMKDGTRHEIDLNISTSDVDWTEPSVQKVSPVNDDPATA